MRDIGVYMVARVLQVLAAFATLRVLTAQLTPEEVGKTAVVLSIAMFFSLSFVSPVANYINRQLNMWHACGLIPDRFAKAGIYLVLVSSLALLVVLIGYEWFGESWEMPLQWITWLVVGVVFLKSLNMSMLTSLNFLGERMSWAIYMILTLCVGLIASWVLTQYEPKAEFWLLGQLAGFLFAGVLATISVMRYVKRVEKEKVGQESFQKLILPVLAFCIPLVIATCLHWIQFQSIRLFLGEMVSLTYLGFFAAGYAVSAGIIGAFETTIQQYYYPKYYKSIEKGGKEGVATAWVSYASFVIPFTLVTGLTIVALAEPLIHFLVDPKFWSASSFVILGAMVEVGRMVGNVYGLAAHGTKKTKILIVPQMLGALAVLVLVPVMLNIMSNDIGVEVSLVAASLLYVVTMHFTIRNHIGVVPKLSSFYPIIYIVPLFIVMKILSSYHTGGLLYDGLMLMVAGVIYLLAVYRLFGKNMGANF